MERWASPGSTRTALQPWLMSSPRARAEAAFRQGVAAQAEGRAGEARAHFEDALAGWPGCAEAWSNLGLLQEDAGEFEAALGSFERALALQPTLYAAALNLGALLARCQRYEEAEAAYGHAVRTRPHAAQAWSNLGALLAALGRLADAQACCCQALGLSPRHDAARFNLAYVLLRQGHYAEGFLCLEARDSLALLQRAIPGPRWAGEPLAGQGLLVVSDAGHGDAIQMARYARLLRERGAGRLVFYGQNSLQRLLQDTEDWDEVLGADCPLPATGWQVWTPAMSLPHLCNSTLDHLPSALPYLRADPAQRTAWRARLVRDQPQPALRIGLVWRGNPLHENDAERSLPHLRALAPLMQLPGVQWVSLQSGAGADDTDGVPEDWPMARLGARLGDFACTAALVAALDAGAIGGAALDVTDPEPLPDGHPLWGRPNCIVTPHTADTIEMVVPLLAERIRTNVGRLADGGPLVGTVDPVAGY